MVTRQRPALLLLAVLALVVGAAHAATPTDGCCAKCIGKSSSVAYTYDPIVFAQCSAVSGGVCCFNCGETSSPTIENASFGSDGETPQVKAGEWIQITWSNIARVTYESYRTNQVKSTTVSNASSEATLEGGVFFVCAKNEGTIAIRGWGSDPCTTASKESTIQVIAGSSNGTCASRTPTQPTTTSAPAATTSSSSASKAKDEDPMISECNLQRASVVETDGKKTCVCAAEWTGAPECTGYPWWKTAATIGGGIAALLSIAVSIKAFVNSRKASQLEKEQNEANGPVLGEEAITIASDPAPSNRVSNQPYEEPPKARDNKEYTL